MKKLLIALAAFAVATCAEAATIKWTTGAVKLPDESGAQTGSLMTASNTKLFMYSLEEAISGDVLSALSTRDSATGVYTMKSGAVTTGVYSKGSATITGSMSTYGAGDDAYAAVVIWRDANGDGILGTGDYYIAGQAKFHLDTDTSKSVAMGLNNLTWSKVEGPAPTPEPTSALLLVLGMAGLALRRRCA